jgi:hypothetical protein
VTRLQAGRPAIHCCIADRGTDVSPHFGVQKGSGSHSHISSGQWGPCSLEVEWSGRVHVHTVPKDKKEWSYTTNANIFSWPSAQSNTWKKIICWCLRVFVLRLMSGRLENMLRVWRYSVRNSGQLPTDLKLLVLT